MGEVKLHGVWPSPFSYRVIWALKLKGIPFEYIEEDLSNKSPLLLQYNPVHKKIPVLVHAGKPICESMIIVQYIDEAWPEKPLMPSDPYQRAMARFWIKFFEDKGIAIGKMFRATGEELEQAKKDSLEMLKTIEEHAAGETKFFIGDEIGLVDIAFGAIAYWLEVMEEVLGVKLLEAHKFPKLAALINNFKEEPIIKENLPDHHDMLVFFKGRREKLLA
ncbi:glutathione S-transferase-like [Tripterygium wilfordii]|uniref:glutathione transferase n=1 Tax=Tripterygium wilfordii TaxID=458696 RepID=A0A7J7DNA3_TRIWF|nr:probable glutathione S-transferase [Tripterygium wilfordii]KAF5747566.1 glutathione S-transferase-like [Tripterygium wilfordii]